MPRSQNFMSTLRELEACYNSDVAELRKEIMLLRQRYDHAYHLAGGVSIYTNGERSQNDAHQDANNNTTNHLCEIDMNLDDWPPNSGQSAERIGKADGAANSAKPLWSASSKDRQRNDAPLSSRRSLETVPDGRPLPSERSGTSQRSFVESPARHSRSAFIIQKEEPEHDLHQPLWIRRARYFVSHPRFELLCVSTILLNVVTIAMVAQRDGMKLEVDHLDALEQESNVFDSADYFFFIASWLFEAAFASEICIKLIVFQLRFFKDFWNVFDFIVVAMCLTAQIVGSVGFDMKMVRTMRLLKLIRLIQLSRAIQAMDGLYVMVTALKGSFFVLIWTAVLLVTIQIAIALTINQALVLCYFKEASYPVEERITLFAYFGTFARSFLTSFEMMLANWPPVARLLSESVSQWFIVFCIFHKLVFGFAVVGVINGVFMQETFKVAANDEVIMTRQKEGGFHVFAEKMRKLFEQADTSGDGKVDIEEFRNILHHKDVRKFLISMDLKHTDADTLFALIHGGDGEVEQEELIDGLGRMRGPARSIDVNKMLVDMKSIIDRLQDSVNAVSV